MLTSEASLADYAAGTGRAQPARRVRGRRPCQKSSSQTCFTVDYSGASRVGLMRLLGGAPAMKNQLLTSSRRLI